MKRKPVEKFITVLLSRSRIDIGNLADRQTHHLSHSDRRFFFEELAGDIPLVGLECHVEPRFALARGSRCLGARGYRQTDEQNRRHADNV